jgi:DeoR family glycerol-3-phosphate regulon repressor
VIGCSALDHDGDMLDYDMQEIGVSQAILAQSRQTYVVADHTKFTRSAPVKIASLRDVDRFYTDTALPNTLTQLCAENGTQVISLGHPTVKHAD